MKKEKKRNSFKHDCTRQFVLLPTYPSIYSVYAKTLIESIVVSLTLTNFNEKIN